MTGLFAAQDDAATPLTPEEIQGLIPTYIAFRHELNAAEQENILRAQDWALRQHKADLLTEKFLKDLHRRMLGDVWRWAGKYRSSARNIGIDHWLIPMELRTLLADTHALMEFRSCPADEIAVRFHHRLVAIHPFPNGNGRHARLMADLLAMRLGRMRFTWGSAGLTSASATRSRYIEALRAADRHRIEPLLEFARS